jgi:hypothetical protein
LTGPNPVDRGKPGSKIPILSERAGIPLSLAVPAALRIASEGIESSTKPGTHRRATERTIAWPTGHRRPTIRYERKAEHFPAFATNGG